MREDERNVRFEGESHEKSRIATAGIQPREIEKTILLHQAVSACRVEVDAAGPGNEVTAYIVPAPKNQWWPSVGEYSVYDPLLYRLMTKDRVRNEAYRRAIQKAAADRIVVDVGTGGDAFLAILCAEAGAKRVYAVEILESAFENAKKTIRNRHLQDIVHVVHGDSRDIQLPEIADVCVSEIVGAIGSCEGAVPILANARRFLRPGGVMVPRRSVTRIAAAASPIEKKRPVFGPLASYYANSIFEKAGRPFDLRVSIRNFEKKNLATDIQVFEDFETGSGYSDLLPRHITMTVERDCHIEGFVLWVNLYVGDEGCLDVLNHNLGSWLPVFFPAFYPGVAVSAGDTIRCVCSVEARENSQFPDYRIVGTICRQAGAEIQFEYQSPRIADGFRQSSFYKDLFAGYPSLEASPPSFEAMSPSSQTDTLDVVELQNFLRQHLPEQMMPDTIIVVDSLPADEIEYKAPGMPEKKASHAHRHEVRKGQNETVLSRASIELSDRDHTDRAAALSEAELHKILYEWNDTADEYPSDKCIHELFEEQVEKRLTAVAVEYEDRQLSYREINRRSNQLAHYLRSLGVKPDTRVAICVERGLEMIVALLGVLKAGGAYVPLDPASPMDRLHFMLEDGDPLILLTQTQLLRKTIDKLPPGLRAVDLMDADAWSRHPESNPGSVKGAAPRHLAYMIYTSGSTGNPKGVLIEHRAVCNQIKALQARWQIGPQDRVLQFASIAFDVAVEEVFLTLLSGATLVLRDWNWVGAQEFWGLLERRGITVADLPTRFWSQMVEDRAAPIPSNVRLLVIGGETVDGKALANWFQRDGYRPTLWNAYGPTETTINATLHEVKADASTWKSIGRPTANTRVYILDGRRQPVPVGVTGELYIAGAGLARGYWNRPELTAESFVDDPFTEEAAARMYKTGDLGRWLPDGTIEFVGRNDDQVKIRGYRIELGEIETRLLEHEGVEEAAIVASKKEDGDQRLVAYYVMNSAYRSGKENGTREAVKTDQVMGWATTYNAICSERHSLEDPTFNIAGWNSSYTGQPIAAEEMREWVENTVERIQSLRPKRVWEIGCGTGLLLFPIAPACTLYRGTDISAVELNFVRQQLLRSEPQMPQVVLDCRAAHESWSAENQEKFDLVVVNSVVQHFPDLQYLVTVLTDAIRALQPGGKIFIGDVRSYPLLDVFHTSVQLYRAPDSLSCDALLNRVQKKIREEGELVVDPGFFAALPRWLPQINQVEVHLKRGRARNELTCFRYDVVLHIGEQVAATECEWLDWNRDFLSLSVLAERLKDTLPQVLGITDIPNVRLNRDVVAVSILNRTQRPATVGELRAKLDHAQDTGVEIEDLWELAQESGYAIEVRSSCSVISNCDVVFRRKAADGRETSHGVVKFPGESVALRSLASYATDPIQQMLTRTLATELRSWLAASLPEYMLPAAYVRMERLPLTANGKLDRDALPAPEGDAFATSGYAAPEGETERMLAEIWAELLQVERVGRRDNFFELGGHSLLAVTLMERMRQRGFEMDVRELFFSPTLAALASSLGEQAKVQTAPENRIPAGCSRITPEMLPLVEVTPEEIAQVVGTVRGGAQNVQDIYPLAPLQEGILFHHLMSGETDPYLLAFQMRFDSRARLDSYLAALQAVIDRHDILRTAMVWEGLREAVQVVWRKAPLRIEEVQLDAANGDGAEQMYARFNPRRNRIDLREAPMLRAYVAFDRDKQCWLLMMLLHHLVGDHTTEELMQAEIEAHLLGQEERLPLALPFRNLVAQARQGMSREEHELFFRQMLGDVEEPTAPFGLLDVQGDGTEVEEARMMVEEALARQMREQARKLSVSVASLCHLAWGRLVAKTSGRDDVVFGTVLLGRMQGGVGADRVMGLFTNTLPVRLQIGTEGVEASVRHTHRVLGELMRHEHASLALAQRCSRVSMSRPLFSGLLNYHHSTRDKIKRASLSWEGIEELRAEERSNYPFVLLVEDLGEDFVLIAQVQAGIGAKRMCQYMLNVLGGLAAALEMEPGMAVGALEVMGKEERHQVLYEWNNTQREYASERCVQSLFEQQVERSPEADAVVSGEMRLSYRELNERSNQLAHNLIKLGVGQEVTVGICMERSWELVVAIMGVLKAGGAYLPLDPEYPAERLGWMVEDSGAPVVLTDHKTRNQVPIGLAQLIDIDEEQGEIEKEEKSNPQCISSGSNTAYIIYTSGSTGQPKGVVVPHRAVVRLVCNNDYIQIEAGDRIAQAANTSFDAATFEIWGALLNGAVTVILPRATILSPDQFAQALSSQRIDVIFVTTALFNQMAREEGGVFAGVREVLFGGEAVDVHWVRKVLEHGPKRLLHVYGPTENTTFSTWQEVTKIEKEATTVGIGKAIANSTAYVMDRWLQPVPVGVVGELYLGGAGLARGYVNRPEQTAEQFVSNPFGESGERMYRTGDLVRWQRGGVLEFVGRADEQVKIRGFRVELGEIEATLVRYGGVKQAAVIAREEEGGEKRLIGYVVVEDGQRVEGEELLGYLSQKLPAYMVPASVMMLESLPLTPNGKLDRKALPHPEFASQETFLEPRNDVERVLCRLWGEVLGVPRVGISDNFFRLGGDSILSIRVIARAKKEGLRFTIGQLFKNQTIQELAQEIHTGQDTEPSGYQQLQLISEADRLRLPEDIEDAYPLTRLQAGMRFHSDYDSESALYHDILSYQVLARLDESLLREAVEQTCARHPILRTSFDLGNYSQPLQLVHRQAEPAMSVEDISGLTAEEQEQTIHAWIEEEKKRPLDISHAPLLRYRIHRRSLDEFQLTMTFHHSIFDGWSDATLLTELLSTYCCLLKGERRSRPLLASRFASFVQLELETLQSAETRQFWEEQLANLPLAAMPWKSGARERIEGATLRVPVSEKLSQALQGLAARLKVPLKSVLLAAHMRVVKLLSGQHDVISGLATNGRLETTDGEQVLGLFLNTVPLRMPLRGGRWEDLILETVRAEQALLPYRRYPLLDLQLLAGNVELFQMVFNFTQFHVLRELQQVFDLTIRETDGFGATNFPLIANFGLDLPASSVQLHLDYDASMISASQIERIAEYYVNTMQAMTTAPEMLYQAANVLGEREQREILEEFNAARREVLEKTLPQMFEEQVEKTPEAVAVEYEEQQLSYGELNRRSNQVAHYLREMGVKAETRVAICLDRSVKMIVALLGILKAGGAYVPLDPDYPAERIRFMMEDTEVEMIVTASGVKGPWLSAGVRCIDLDAEREEIARRPEGNVQSRITGENLAYIIYTSGSTGIPKGTAVPHRSCMGFMCDVDYVTYDEKQTLFQHSSTSWDALTLELWPALVHGGKCVLHAGETITANDLRHAIQHHGVTLLFLTTALFNSIMDSDPDAFTGLKQLLVGGEALSPLHIFKALQFLPETRIGNVYGPSECTAFTTSYPIPPQPQPLASIPIGRPIGDRQVFLLDENLTLVPIGTAGEIFIGGPAVARGYVGRPQLTSEKFIPDPFSGEPGARMYRTGDLGRWRPDGNIEFLGRVDEQVKVRGFRIEPGEIEAVLRTHPGISQVAVLMREDKTGEKQLVAYYVSAKTAAVMPGELEKKKNEIEVVGEETLREYLSKKLPAYMMPAAYLSIERMPLTPNGKVDRKALPAPEFRSNDQSRAPQTPQEEMLCGLFAEVLGLERVGIDDNFFKLGGHSLLATRLVSRICSSVGVNLPIRTIFECPTVVHLSCCLQQKMPSQIPSLYADPEMVQRES